MNKNKATLEIKAKYFNQIIDIYKKESGWCLGSDESIADNRDCAVEHLVKQCEREIKAYKEKEKEKEKHRNNPKNTPKKND